MLDHPRDHGPRLQARAGIIEEDRLLAARGLRAQPRDVPIVWHGLLPFCLKPYTAEDMANFDFAPVDEQLDYLQKGAAEIIRVSDLARASGDFRGKPASLCASRRDLTPPRPICIWATPC